MDRWLAGESDNHATLYVSGNIDVSDAAGSTMPGCQDRLPANPEAAVQTPDLPMMLQGRALPWSEPPMYLRKVLRCDVLFRIAVVWAPSPRRPGGAIADHAGRDLCVPQAFIVSELSGTSKV